MIWSLPHIGPFPEGGFDESGNVLYAQEIGKLKLGEGDDAEELPINIKFSTKYKSGSPYLGYGWMLPLLDSRIVQLNEREFLAEMPGGWTRIFYRQKADASILEEGGGWKAEIVGDLITAHADCGWKLIFKKGKLISMTTPKNHRLDYQYRDGKVVAIKETGGAVVLEVESDPKSGETVALKIGKDERVGVELADKPRVQNIGGINVVDGMDRSLNKLGFASGRESTFDFTVTEELMPTLKIGDGDGTPRTIGWNPVNNRIINDGEWKYNISFPRQGASAKVERVNSKGQSEMWFRDTITGLSHRRGITGTTTTKRWFTSGPARGRIRSIEIADPDEGTTKLVKRSYDSNGLPTREMDSAGNIRKYVETFGGRTLDVPENEKRMAEAKIHVIKEQLTAIVNFDARDKLLYKMGMLYGTKTGQFKDAYWCADQIHDERLKVAIICHVLWRDTEKDMEMRLSLLNDFLKVTKDENARRLLTEMQNKFTKSH